MKHIFASEKRNSQTTGTFLVRKSESRKFPKTKLTKYISLMNTNRKANRKNCAIQQIKFKIMKKKNKRNELIVTREILDLFRKII